MNPEPHNRLPDPRLFARGHRVQVAGRIFELHADETGKRWWQDITP